MINQFFIFIIRVYQYTISPFLLPHCRFMPTCSQYSIMAFKKYGLIKGLYLTFRRIARCHCFGKYGYDPLP